MDYSSETRETQRLSEEFVRMISEEHENVINQGDESSLSLQMAIPEQKKADKKISRIAKKHKVLRREKKELQNKLLQLEKEFEAQHRLLEVLREHKEKYGELESTSGEALE